MTSTMTLSPDVEKQARQQITDLLSRSSTDMAFRARLLSEPNAAYTEETGNGIPAGVSFAFVEKQDGKTMIVLPPFGAEGDLSDAELEAVSGGTEPCTVAVIFLTGVAVGIWLVDKAVSE
jgi:hypothetical protein